MAAQSASRNAFGVSRRSAASYNQFGSSTSLASFTAATGMLTFGRTFGTTMNSSRQSLTRLLEAVDEESAISQQLGSSCVAQLNELRNGIAKSLVNGSESEMVRSYGESILLLTQSALNCQDQLGANRPPRPGFQHDFGRVCLRICARLDDSVDES